VYIYVSNRKNNAGGGVPFFGPLCILLRRSYYIVVYNNTTAFYPIVLHAVWSASGIFVLCLSVCPSVCDAVHCWRCVLWRSGSV